CFRAGPSQQRRAHFFETRIPGGSTAGTPYSHGIPCPLAPWSGFRAQGRLMKSQSQILVVDGDQSMSESLATWLRKDGHLGDTASSGQEAVERVRARSYAVCFIDLTTPEIDGMGTIRQIRRLLSDASIIAVTVSAAVDDAIAALQQGASEYVVKPCSPLEV